MGRQKADNEILAIEEAQRAAEAAMAGVVEYLRASDAPHSEESHAIIDRILAEHACESPKGHIVAGGSQAVEPHDNGSGALKKGEAIVIDIFPRSTKTGYFADMSRTVCIGAPSKDLQKMYDTVLRAQELAIEMLRPGVECASLQQAVEDFFRAEGYATSGKGTLFTYAEGFVHALGHGVGKEIHEHPHIGRKTEEKLMPGDVITIEPGLYYKDLGGVRIEDLLLITENGYRNLTNFSKKFTL